MERALVFFVLFPACGTRSGILCNIFRVWNALWCFVFFFSMCGTHTGILCSIFSHVERALVFFIVFFRVWNENWYFVLYFSACGMRSDVFYIHFAMEYT